MIIGLGSDLCNIERIAASLERWGEKFERRCFTDVERAKAARRPYTRAGTYAKRFAAKEAYTKAIGTGFSRGVFHKDIGVVNAPSGAPTLALTGGAAKRLAEMVPDGHEAVIHLTLTDDHPWAQAFVVIEARSLMTSETPDRAMDDKAPEAKADEIAAGEKKPEKVDWVREIRGLALMLLAVLAFHTFIAKPFYIPSGSMEPNLLVGDRLVVSKYPYGWSWVSASFHVLPRSHWRIAPKTPEYGDIVIVVPPDKTEDYIKRVIGLPGDTIAVVNGQVILNGKPVPKELEPPVQIPEDSQMCDGRLCLSEFDTFRRVLPSGKVIYEPPTYRETLPNGASYLVLDDEANSLGDNYGPVKVPDGDVFLMGDNRDHSADSRFPAGEYEGLGGPVPMANVGGRAEFITFSLDGSTSWNPISWWKSLRPGRAWTSLRPEIRGKGKTG